MMSKVSGKFDDFAGKIEIDRTKPGASSVEFTIKTASIDTGNSDRDNHLRSADFFDAAKNPEITFRSTKIVPTKAKNVYDVTGNLTMHGVTKQVTIPV
jgi:polyisoprenoid-binding protein YceI